MSWKFRALGLHAALVSAQADLAQLFGRRVGESFSIGPGLVRCIVLDPEAIHVLPPHRVGLQQPEDGLRDLGLPS